jgi:aspartyl-tRNA(Asn)/glutamyl-tRNA(Gln) amidotransferase subunit C
MSDIDRNQVRHIAKLARLELDTDDLDRLGAEMASILSHFEELSEVELVHEKGPADRGLAPRLRDDEVNSDPLAFPPSEMAPEWREGFFVVPRLPALDSPRPDDEGEPA